jgi:hypothetical protein
MKPYDWYLKAKERLENFLPSLDESIEVDVDTDVITPDDGGPSYETFMLAFSHQTNPNLHWTMEIQMDEVVSVF